MELSYVAEGQGPVVVLLHGFPLDQTMWQPLRAILGSNHRVVTPDLRGIGATGAPEGDYSVDGMADDVVELLDKLGLDQPIVLGGLSMGGYVVLSIALRFPERLKGLVLLNSRAAADTPSAARLRRTTADQIEASGDPLPFLDGMVSRLFAPATLIEHPELVEHWRSKMAGIPARTIVATLRGLADRPDRTNDLLKIRLPTLVLAGSDDQVVPLDESRSIVQLLPLGDLAVISRAGHLTPVENPGETAEAVQDFLDRIG